MDVYQHYNRFSPIRYRKIYTQNNNSTLQITPSHSLLVRKKYREHAQYRFASEIENGDYLYLATASNNLVEATVTKIDDLELFDAYAPLTLEGNILVNRLVVSCYGTFTHSTGHLVKMIRRWWLHFYLNLFF